MPIGPEGQPEGYVCPPQPEHPVNQPLLFTGESENSERENAGFDRNPDGCARLPDSRLPNRRMSPQSSRARSGWETVAFAPSCPLAPSTETPLTTGYCELTWLEFGSPSATLQEMEISCRRERACNQLILKPPRLNQRNLIATFSGSLSISVLRLTRAAESIYCKCDALRAASPRPEHALNLFRPPFACCARKWPKRSSHDANWPGYRAEL